MALRDGEYSLVSSLRQLNLTADEALKQGEPSFGALLGKE